MKYLIMLILSIYLNAQELKIKANSFQADEKKGISIFEGDVNILKKNDELNASKVTIYTDEKNKPTKFIAQEKVSFHIETKQKIIYMGSADKVVFIPKQKEYHFYGNVYLSQLNEKKEIRGDEVVLNINDGKAYAKGMEREPVLMIFNIEEDKE